MTKKRDLSDTGIKRRDLLCLAGWVAAGVASNAVAADASARAPGNAPHGPDGRAAATPYPRGFLWGVATSGHQVEGSNVNSDVWTLEHVKPSFFAESSGSACDQYQRYADDIALLAGLGFNSYRFSLEWSRIEPSQGEFLSNELDHYRRVLAACHEHGVSPVVTFNHGTAPRWFAAKGGWENSEAPASFARFCENAAAHLGDLITVASTLNEPNIGLVLKWLDLPPSVAQVQGAMLRSAAAASGSDRFSSIFAGDAARSQAQLLEAHRLGYSAMKSGPGNYPVGVNIAIIDDQAVGADSQRDSKRRECYAPWLDAASRSDYVGVQTYGRSRIGNQGALPPDPGAELTQMGEEFYPEALENTIRYAAAATGKPVYVTENGIATENDTRRIEYVRRALAGVERCLHDGVDVRSYIHWSLLDNFEWLFGYRPKFGLIAVDRKTLRRTVKPSARYLGGIARRNHSRLDSGKPA